MGSPASDPSVAGEPPSSEREDEIFADLKARIGRLWEEGGGVEDIRAVLIGDRTSK